MQSAKHSSSIPTESTPHRDEQSSLRHTIDALIAPLHLHSTQPYFGILLRSLKDPPTLPNLLAQLLRILTDSIVQLRGTTLTHAQQESLLARLSFNSQWNPISHDICSVTQAIRSIQELDGTTRSEFIRLLHTLSSRTPPLTPKVLPTSTNASPSTVEENFAKILFYCDYALLTLYLHSPSSQRSSATTRTLDADSRRNISDILKRLIDILAGSYVVLPMLDRTTINSFLANLPPVLRLFSQSELSTILDNTVSSLIAVSSEASAKV